MAKKRERKYSMGDEPMLERGQVFHDQLSGELAHFTSRFPWMDGPWLAAFQADITAADAFPKDESVILDLKVLTGDVTASMQQGYAALQTLGGYAKLAYPTDPARERVFGQQYWADARENTLKLQEALELAFNKAENASYKPGLLGKGYTQAEIDQLDALADELQTKNGLQEALKVGRNVTSQDRIAMHNVVWSHMQTINTCASVVWAADAARMRQYQLYPSHGAAAASKGTISGTVSAHGGNPISGALVVIDALGRDTTTDGNGHYTLNNVEEGSYQLDFSANGYDNKTVDDIVVLAGETIDVDVNLAMVAGGSASISGTVLDSGSLTPIEGATITLSAPGNGSSYVTTNANGEYMININELPGAVNGTIEASAGGYISNFRPITVHPNEMITEDFSLELEP